MNLGAIGGVPVGQFLSYTQATGTKSSSGDNTLVSAPGAGFRLVVKELVVQNESTTATTVVIKNGATSEWRALLDQYRALSMAFQQGEEYRLAANSALVLNLSGANSHGYSVRYRIEPT